MFFLCLINNHLKAQPKEDCQICLELMVTLSEWLHRQPHPKEMILKETHLKLHLLLSLWRKGTTVVKSHTSYSLLSDFWQKAVLQATDLQISGEIKFHFFTIKVKSLGFSDMWIPIAVREKKITWKQTTICSRIFNYKGLEFIFLIFI